MDPIRTQIKFYFTFNLDNAVWVVGGEGIRTERAGGVVYFHSCLKMKVVENENDFPTEVTARLGIGEKTVLKTLNPFTKVFYQNYTLTECIFFYPTSMRLSNSTWITIGKKIMIVQIGAVSIYNETRREVRPLEFTAVEKKGCSEWRAFGGLVNEDSEN